MMYFWSGRVLVAVLRLVLLVVTSLLIAAVASNGMLIYSVYLLIYNVILA